MLLMSDNHFLLFLLLYVLSTLLQMPCVLVLIISHIRIKIVVENTHLYHYEKQNVKLDVADTFNCSTGGQRQAGPC